MKVSYICRETLIALAINASGSLILAIAVFGGEAHVSALGPGGLLADVLPQTLMLSFMGTIVPSFLTQRRLRAGQIKTQLGRGVPLPNNIVARALIVAVVVSVLAYALHWVVFHEFAIESAPLLRVLVYKTLYGALLALAITPVILRRALMDGSGEIALPLVGHSKSE